MIRRGSVVTHPAGGEVMVVLADEATRIHLDGHPERIMAWLGVSTTGRPMYVIDPVEVGEGTHADSVLVALDEMLATVQQAVDTLYP